MPSLMLASEMHQDETLMWSTIRRTFERLQRHAPEGYVPRIYVRLFDGETFEPAGVGPIGSWLFFEIDQEGDEVTADRRVVATRPENIGRVEIRFIPADGRPVGFHVSPPPEPDEPPPSE